MVSNERVARGAHAVVSVDSVLHAQGRTVTSLMEEALRNLLDLETRTTDTPRLPTWSGGRLLVDLDDKDAVWEILDADEPR